MAVLLDEAGAALFDEAVADLYDEAGPVTVLGALPVQFVSRYPPLTSKILLPCTPAGDAFATWYTVYVEVVNTGSSPASCTVTTPGKVEDIAEAGYTFTVPAHGETEAGPFPAHLFGKPATITYTDATSLSIAVKRYGS